MPDKDKPPTQYVTLRPAKIFAGVPKPEEDEDADDSETDGGRPHDLQDDDKESLDG